MTPIPGDGRTLLARTVAQVREWSDDVHITSGDDHRFRIPGTTHHVRSPDDPSEFASTRGLWSITSRTCLLLGDVYFTDSAIADILACPDRDVRAFGRYGPSPVTGTPYGEIFGWSWWAEHLPLLDKHLDVVHRTRAAGTVTRPPGWMLLRSLQGTPLGKHRVRAPWWVEIPPDTTDDLDSPDDLRRHPVFGGARAGR